MTKEDIALLSELSELLREFENRFNHHMDSLEQNVALLERDFSDLNSRIGTLAQSTTRMTMQRSFYDAGKHAASLRERPDQVKNRPRLTEQRRPDGSIWPSLSQ
jgi:hypothetical protein